MPGTHASADRRREDVPEARITCVCVEPDVGQGAISAIRDLTVTALIDRVDRPGPSRLLRVVDLPQIKQCLLYMFPAANPAVLHYAVVAMILPVLAPVCHA
ncbi:MAG: hypothetical protein R6V03_00745 [Kiritimatiellia bacterium]